MKRTCLNGLGRWLALAAAALVLAGCAATRAYRDGNALLAEGKLEQGLSKLEEATRLEPSNAEYRIALSSKKLDIVNRLNTHGEAARQQGRLVDAEKAYTQVLAIDPNNAFAKQGIDAVVKERRHRQLVEQADALFKKGGNADLADALELLRPVLAENPAQRDALNLQARIVEQQARQKPAEAQLSAAFRKPITLEFRDAPLRSIFDVIAKVSGLNFFFDKDVRPDLKATVLAKQTSIEDAIHILLVTNQLEQAVLNQNSILIYPNTPQKLKDYQALAVRSFYLANADVKSVSNTIKTILKTKDLVVDERLGLIIMRDTRDAIRMAERIVALQDLSDPEVMLEVEVMEVKRSRLMNLGIRWPDSIGLSLLPPAATGSVPSTPSTGTTQGSLTLGSLRSINRDAIHVAVGGVTVNANKENSDSNILANPRIRVRNKEKARILIGDRVPVITTTSTSTGFVADSVSYVEVGLKLEVEPNIYLDEEVAIKVNLEVSNLVREVVSKSGTLSYQIGTRNAATVLRLKDGETQVLAGLISDEDRRTADKVPLVGELPVLSRLFGNQSDDTQRSEIVLAITPHVIRSIRRPDLLAAEFSSGTESNVGGRALALGSPDPEPEANDAKTATPAGKPGDAAAGTSVPPVPAGGDGKVAVAPGGPMGFTWQGPAQVKVGDQFSAVLRVSSQGAVKGLPLLVGFDPAVLQVISVQEGDFLKQANGKTTFSERIDPTQGKIFVAAVRQNSTGSDAGINGTGDAVIVNFKAVKPASSARVQLLSATPEPSPSSPLLLPVELALKVQ